ncbi:MAG: DUF3999 domain-containing protein [Bacillota bacterium]
MRIAAVALALLATHAGAQHFRSEAPITLTGKDTYYRIALPLEVYRDARGDLGDVRVLNSSGEAVPMAFAPEPEAVVEQPQVATLPQFAVTSRVLAGVSAGKLDIQVRTRADGALVSVQDRSLGKATPRTIAYLLDASAVKFPVGALRFDWETGPGTQIVRVNVDASDDLREWHPVAPHAALVRVEQNGQVLSQPRVTLGTSKVKYFRVTWDGLPFALRSVEAESAATTKPAERATRKVEMSERTSAGDIVYDLGASLPVETLRVVFPEPNSVAAYEIAARSEDSKAPWRTVATGTFHRLVRDGSETQSSSLEIPRWSARYWKLHALAKPAAGADSAAPSLEVQWRPAQVVFVAKGEPPYSLVFGDKQASSTALPITGIVPGYEKHAEEKFPAATVGLVKTSEARASWRDIEPRRLALWTVLVGGVLALGFMAWRLLREFGDVPRTPV